MPILYPSTIAFIKRCVNIVVQTIVVAAAFAIFLGISIIFNVLIDYTLKAFNIPDPVRERIALFGLAVPIMIAIAIVLTNIDDIWNLTKTSMRTPDEYTQTDAEDEN